MTQIELSKPVLVTGATGYVAGWIVKQLLDKGVRVHAAVRDSTNEKKIQHLKDLANQSSGTIKFFDSDLLKEGSFESAMQDCELVYHTASPFSLAVNDPQKDLVDPAKLGTRNVLEQANQVASVKRVVVTSSCASIYGDNIDLQNAKGPMFTESDWNNSSSLTHQPYFFSKVEAEREAWRIADQQERWDLVTINPSLVIGPGVNPKATSASFSLIKQFGDGTLKAGVPDFGIGLVDVREVATAHVNAGYTPEANGRYVISAHNTNFPQVASVLAKEFGDKFPVPKRTVPKWFAWIAGPIIDRSLTRKVISRNVGFPFLADSSKSVQELKINYRPMDESLCEMFQQLIDNQII